MQQQNYMNSTSQFERAAGQSMHIKKPSVQKMNPNTVTGMQVPQSVQRSTVRGNMNMTYTDVNLNQSQMVYQDFTDQQML